MRRLVQLAVLGQIDRHRVGDAVRHALDAVEARVARAYELMLAELDEGRKPYWGQILPAIWLMLERVDDYTSGADLAADVDAEWIAAELLEFPERARLIREQAEHEAVFRNEDYPLGSPRASECGARDDLRPFRTD